MTDFEVYGTLIWYYFICKREVWLQAHQINPHEDNPFLEVGRFLHEQSYARDRKRIRLENIEIDIIKQEGDQLIVAEVKKSSRFEKSATMQLLFYLRLLKEYGIHATGELRFPKEKKRMEVSLNDAMLRELEAAEEEIRNIILSSKPPPAQKIPMCRNCAYREFCWA